MNKLEFYAIVNAMHEVARGEPDALRVIAELKEHDPELAKLLDDSVAASKALGARCAELLG